jgi:drug/metabolite transporter (DMT)-like permease
MKSNPAQAYRYIAPILTGAVFISFSGVWVALAQVEPMISAFYRVFFGAGFLLIASIVCRDLQRVRIQTLFYCVLCGLCFSGNLVCWHQAVVYVGPGLATILGNFQVFVLTLISLLFFGQSPRISYFIALALAFIGLFLVIGIDWEMLPATFRIGVYLGLMTALLYAAFILLLRKIQQLEGNISFIFTLLLVSIFTSLLLGPLAWASGKSFAIPSLTSLGSLVALGLFSQTIGWAFISRSLPHVIPSLAGLILLLQPALAFLWDVLFFDRKTSMIQSVGIVVVLAAIYLGTRSSKKIS